MTNTASTDTHGLGISENDGLRPMTFVVVSGPRGTSPVTSESDTTHRETVTTMKAAGWRVMADYRVSTYLLLGEYAAAHVVTRVK